MKQERVVITGIGSISALGNDHHAFWKALSAGQSGVAAIQQVDCSAMRFQSAAEVKGFVQKEHFETNQLFWLDRFAQFALISAREAIKDSNISPLFLANERTAVITGSSMGGQQASAVGYERTHQQKKVTVSPATLPCSMASSGASHIASTFGIVGPTYTVSTACASSTHAIGQAFWFIRQGLIDRAITGGSDAPFILGVLRSWEALRVVTPHQCAPFSKDRSGMILGEGGAMLVLESLSSALARGASIYAEMVGFGMSADADHILNPNTVGQCQAMKAVLNDAKIQPQDVQYINAHGTGTRVNDEVESATIRAVFPDAHQHLWVSSTKAAHGHLLGASGALETVATALAIKHQLIPPTLNFLEPDPLCDIPLVVNQARPSEIEYALCSSFAFGGLNAILALRRCII